MVKIQTPPVRLSTIDTRCFCISNCAANFVTHFPKMGRTWGEVFHHFVNFQRLLKARGLTSFAWKETPPVPSGREVVARREKAHNRLTGAACRVRTGVTRVEARHLSSRSRPQILRFVQAHETGGAGGTRTRINSLCRRAHSRSATAPLERMKGFEPSTFTLAR